MQKKPNRSFKIKKNRLKELSLGIIAFLNAILNFFSLKKNKQYWGIVYDSVSKQPLDPVIVKLLYLGSQEVETCVTDIGGRYGFLARPGKFKIFVRKTNYTFPSTYAEGKKDGIYDNLYHGEFFVLRDSSEVVAPNIPMDPEKFDWNQQAKKSVENTNPFWKFFFKRLVALLFWFGLVFSCLTAARFYPDIPVYFYYIGGAYLGLIILASLVPEKRLWGECIIKAEVDDMYGIFLELHSSQFPSISFGKAITHENGRFLLRASKGSYLLTVSRVNKQKQTVLLGTLPVKIGTAGVFNQTIIIK